MNSHDDTRLAELLSEAVSDVEPRSALEDIRDRTRVTSITMKRPWLFATGGAVLATAAVISAIAFAGGSPTSAPLGPDPLQSPTRASAPEPNEPTPMDLVGTAVPVYLVSETPQGLRLYREFHTIDASVDPTFGSAEATVTGRTRDPDYRSLWPTGTGVDYVEGDSDLITVSLLNSSRELPAGMTADEASLAIQQVIFSVQAALGEGRVPVQLLLENERTDMVLGQPASEPLTNGSILQTLAQVNLTFPEEGSVVPPSFTAEGVANSYEATVPWRVLDGESVVAEGFFTAEGWMDKLYLFSGNVNLSGLPVGAYTFEVSTSDPSGGAEGAGPHVDTRTIVIE